MKTNEIRLSGIGSAYRLATLPVDGGVKIWVLQDGEAAA